MINIDAAKGRKAAELLYRAFTTTGVHGRTEMPEDIAPKGVLRGSLEHVLFLTLSVAIDYQREANALWQSARRTFEDPATNYLFKPQSLHEVAWQQVREDLQKHGLSKKVGKDCNIWRTVGITFFKKWGGDPRNLLVHYQWDALQILEALNKGTHLNNGKPVLDYPFLRGKKIGPLWLRMLRDNAGLVIRNLESVPIPVDVHVARATLSLGVVRGQYEGNLEVIYGTIRQAWFKSVQGLRVDGREMIALDVDEPLWHLSKYGCTNRDLTGTCPSFQSCETRAFCCKGKVVIKAAGVLLDT